MSIAESTVTKGPVLLLIDACMELVQPFLSVTVMLYVHAPIVAIPDLIEHVIHGYA